MSETKRASKYFTPFEIFLWCASVILITVSFFVFDGKNYLAFAASLVGVTSLILCAKGNPVGQIIMVIFAVMYGIISWTSAYYGEMITYLGMSAPMAICALVAWLKNPFKGNRAEVRVNKLKGKEVIFSLVLTAAVTVAFYFVLRALGTANLLVSTVSVATSFFAVYLTFRRSAYFALAYAANDFVLIVLWSIAPDGASSYVSVIICFAVFLVNDLYGFFNWMKIMKRQKAAEQKEFASPSVAAQSATGVSSTAE